VILNGTLAEHTGYYSCHYIGSDGFTPPIPSNETTGGKISQAVYIFVNEPGFLLVPPEGNTYIFMSVVSSYPALIPCKATGSHIQVSLRKVIAAGIEDSQEVRVGREHGVYFDPTQGFYFESIQYDNSLDYLECQGKLDGQVEQAFQVNLHFSIDPGHLHPIIDAEEASFVTVNSSFSLTCSVRSEVGVVISGMTWTTPITLDSYRVHMEDTKSVKGGAGGEKGHDQFVVTSRRMVIKNANYSDEGSYTCTVWAQTGKAFSVDHVLKVYDSSIPSFVNLTTDFYKDFESALKRKPGQDVQFVVNVIAIPNVTSCSFEWFKDDVKILEIIPSVLSSSILPGHTSLLKMTEGEKSSPLFQDSSSVQISSGDSSHYSTFIEGKQVVLRIS